MVLNVLETNFPGESVVPKKYTRLHEFRYKIFYLKVALPVGLRARVTAPLEEGMSNGLDHLQKRLQVPAS